MTTRYSAGWARTFMVIANGRLFASQKLDKVRGAGLPGRRVRAAGRLPGCVGDTMPMGLLAPPRGAVACAVAIGKTRTMTTVPPPTLYHLTCTVHTVPWGRHRHSGPAKQLSSCRLGESCGEIDSVG